MNEKEAREIISDGRAEWVSRDYGKAVGYLEAIEKAKVLEDSLRRIANADYRGNRPPSAVDAYHALAQYEKLK